MLGFNTTGSPDNRDYLLGRACIFLSENDVTTGLPECYRPVGNTPNLSVSIDIEELTHRASLCQQFGGAVIDRRLILQQTLNLSMTLEELNHENVAVFFSASTSNPANPAVAGIPEYVLTTNLAVDSCWYPIADPATGIRALGIDQTKLTVEIAPATALVGGGDDYEVDETMGLLRFISGGSGGLAGGETIEVTLAADATAPATIETVQALARSQVRFSVKAVVENANNANEQVELEFHSVLLIGDGDLALVSDELAQMGLSGVAESNSAIAGSPTLTISKAVN